MKYKSIKSEKIFAVLLSKIIAAFSAIIITAPDILIDINNIELLN